MIDTGANTNVIDVKLLPTSFVDRHRTYGQYLQSVSGRVEIVGKFFATIQSGDILFERMPFTILENSSAPVIIGQQLTKHESVRAIHFDNQEQ